MHGWCQLIISCVVCHFCWKSSLPRVHTEESGWQREKNRKRENRPPKWRITFSFSHFNAIFIGCKTHLYSRRSISLGLFRKLTIIQSVSQSVEMSTTATTTTNNPFIYRIQSVLRRTVMRIITVIIIIMNIRSDLHQFTSAPLVHILKWNMKWLIDGPEANQKNILASERMGQRWREKERDEERGNGQAGWSSMCVVMWNGHNSAFRYNERASHFADEQWLT